MLKASKELEDLVKELCRQWIVINSIKKRGIWRIYHLRTNPTFGLET
jgi:hypothetical protein